MLFNSYEFLFVFLPVTLGVFYAIGDSRPMLAASWLAFMSVAFYAYWIPVYVGILLTSVAFNFLLGKSIVQAAKDGASRRKRVLLASGIASNLAALAYYKYANFFIGNINAAAGVDLFVPEIILPLGISFFTFTQIAFLVDAGIGKAAEPNFIHYLLFVTYFPHLIAGPILHHAEMMPQFARRATYRFDPENIAVGLTIFAIGLFKKVVIADGVAVHATPLFDAAANGATPDFYQAWTGALCYTFQLYFDFSGYSDMAIGLSRLFGILMPLNFNSPYKAANIIEFWRRWHITLSRFLREYLYIPLGGGRRGLRRQITNILITMLLGGLWHGAGWTFVVWGGLHGVYLAANHLWRAALAAIGVAGSPSSPAGRFVARVTTFAAVVVAWVFFRAESLDAALRIVGAMLRLQDAAWSGVTFVTLPYELLNVLHWRMIAAFPALGIGFGTYGLSALWWIGVLLPCVWFMPNTQELLRAHRPGLEIARSPEIPVTGAWRWRLRNRYAVLAGVLTLVSLLNMNRISEFLYFQF